MEITKIKNLYATLEKRKDRYPLSAWVEKLQYVKDEVVINYLKENAIDDLDDLVYGAMRNCDDLTRANLEGHETLEEYQVVMNELRARIKEKIDRMK